MPGMRTSPEAAAPPSPPPGTGLRVTGLTRRFGGRAVVEALDLHVPAGSVVGLLGPNGCGKSTTMKLLAGALVPHDGSFTLDGVPGGVDSLDVKGRTGFVPDVGGLFPRLSAWEHLELAARLFEVDDWRPRAHRLLEALDLGDVAGERAGGYSHGMSRKLSAAIALLPSPRLLLADEPFDGVDQAGIDVLADLLATEARRGAAVLVTTHVLDVAERLCDTIHLLQRGRVRASLDARELAGGTLPGMYRDMLGVVRQDPDR